MSTDGPLVSVVLPVRDGAATLERAVRSVQWQTYERWELLIVDDGSTDGSEALIARLADEDARLRVLRHDSPRGIAECLNEGVAAAEGSLVARMDADDIAFPVRLQRQVAFLQTHPDVDLVGAWMMVFRGEGELRGFRSSPSRDEEIKRRGTGGFRLFHPTWMGRSEWFRRYRYDPRAKRCEDQILLLDACSESRFANVPETLLGYREDALDLRKVLATRFQLARYGAERYLMAHRLGPAMEVIAIQAAKALVDAVTVATRTEAWLSRHRARPPSLSERRRWDEVWRALEAQLEDPK